MKKEIVRLPLFCFVGLCYLIFLSIDFFMPWAWAASAPLKYAALLACVAIAVTGDDPLLRLAMLITALCDYFLLFSPNHTAGVLLFACAQIFHGLRHARFESLGRCPSKLTL